MLFSRSVFVRNLSFDVLKVRVHLGMRAQPIGPALIQINPATKKSPAGAVTLG